MRCRPDRGQVLGYSLDKISFRPDTLTLAWDVILVDEVAEWAAALSAGDRVRLAAAVDMLETYGPSLGRPTVDRIKGSTIHNLKELRPRGSSIRVLFVFDPERRADLLTAGDKAGQWERWYRLSVPLAERRYAEYLRSR